VLNPVTIAKSQCLAPRQKNRQIAVPGTEAPKARMSNH